MPPLRFPTTPIAPDQDQDVTERAMHTVIEVAKDCEHALVDATTVNRAWQVRARIRLCLALLAEVEAKATAKIDRLSEEKN